MAEHWYWNGEDLEGKPIRARAMVREQAAAIARGEPMVTVTLVGGKVVTVEAPKGTKVLVVEWGEEEAADEWV